jgi:hypothetical protein
MFIMLPLALRVDAVANPPVGTSWTDVIQVNPGDPGELNVTWTVKLETLTNSQISFRYTFLGEFGFITDTPCNNPTPLPLPFDRLSFTGSMTGGGAQRPANLVDESLLTAKANYQAPTFVNCWNMANPPPSYPNAISYVRYQGLRFSALHTVPRSEYFSQGATVQLSALTNANPNGVSFLMGTIAIPPIDSGFETTTTKPSANSTTSSPSDPSTTTSTVVDDESTTTVFPDTTDVTRNAILDGVTIGEPGSPATDIDYNLAQETPVQEEQRKQDTASSLVVTATVLVSSLAAFLPSLGSVGAVGAIGAASGVLGVATSRTLSGGQLLPQVPARLQDSYPDVSGRNSRTSSIDSRKDPESDVDFSNPFDVPTQSTAKDGGSPGVERASVGRLFTGVVTVIQHVSRVRFLRPGLRRWAELALVNPAAAALVPFIVTSGAVVLGILRAKSLVAPVAAIFILFLLSVTAPFFAILVSAGWWLGRVMEDHHSFAIGLSESLALLPGLLFIPMMLRGLIGPRGQTKDWERTLAFVCSPLVAVFAYRSWSLRISDVAGSISTRIFDPLGMPLGRPLFGMDGTTAGVYLSIAMSLVVCAIAIAAVRFADDRGHPILMFRSWVKMSDPRQRLRRDYVDVATVELGTPTFRWRLFRFIFAGSLATYLLSEILGWQSIVLVVFFLLGVVFVRRSSRIVSTEPIHPIAKTIPMVALGLAMSEFSISSERAFIAFALVALLVVGTTLIRSRALWE